MGNEEKRGSRGTYSLPEELACHVSKTPFAAGELRCACHDKAGEGLGRKDRRNARLRTAAQMVAIWRGVELPAWEAPYVLRDAKMGSQELPSSESTHT
jgi:hypothetical protein